MSFSTNDLQRIETRIGELIRCYFSTENTSLPEALRPIVNMVTDQALISSQGGKRLRALLTVHTYDIIAPLLSTDETYERYTEKRAAVLDLACAIEVFQTAALVHDDIIDDSDMRRGKPSAHRALELHTTPAIGMGLGVMLGDLLASACISIMDTSTGALPQAAAIRSTFLTMHRDVEIGQVLDLAIERMPLNDPQALCDASYEVFRWKTASYTTIAPLHLALLAAGMSQEQAAYHAFAIGLPLGVGFQLTDDLLDVVGSSRQTGKPIGGDIREGKRTVLLSDALRNAHSDYYQELYEIYEAPARTDSQVKRVIELFELTGAIESSYIRINEMWNEACQAITQLELPQQATEELTALCASFIPKTVVPEIEVHHRDSSM